MARHELTNYYASWDHKNHKGHFIFYWLGGNNMIPGVRIDDPAEFQVMIDLLRNESPILWDSSLSRLSVGYGGEPVGEGEGAGGKG